MMPPDRRGTASFPAPHRLAVSVVALVSGAAFVGFFSACGTSSTEGAVTSIDSSFVQMSDRGDAPAGPSDARTDAPADDAGDADPYASDGGDGGATSCPGAMAELDAAIGVGVCGQCIREECATFAGACQRDCTCVEALTTIFTCFDLMGSAGVCEQSLSRVPAPLQNAAVTCDFLCEHACDPAYVAPGADAASDAAADSDAGDTDNDAGDASPG